MPWKNNAYVISSTSTQRKTEKQRKEVTHHFSPGEIKIEEVVQLTGLYNNNHLPGFSISIWKLVNHWFQFNRLSPSWAPTFDQQGR